MSKATVTRLFVAAVAAAVVGIVVALATLVGALADGVVTFGGPNVVTIDGETFAGALRWLVVAAVIFGCGVAAAVASWIGALFNTYRLEDKTWFVTLLALGLFSLGWLAMIAYVFAGPDSTADGASKRGVTTAGLI